MAKRKRREKSLAEYEADVNTEEHRARMPRDHVAQEYYEKGDNETAFSIIRRLRPSVQRTIIPAKKWSRA